MIIRYWTELDIRESCQNFEILVLCILAVLYCVMYLSEERGFGIKTLQFEK